jgi:hypothetical protein
MSFSELFNNWPEEERKTCRKCNKTLPLSKFCKSSGANYLRAECRECERTNGAARKKLRKLVLPPGEGYLCPICGKDEQQLEGAGGKGRSAWCCDHDHVTGNFRGWLCHNCNRAIGMMNDNVKQLQAAISYLEKAQETL